MRAHKRNLDHLVISLTGDFFHESRFRVDIRIHLLVVDALEFHCIIIFTARYRDTWYSEGLIPDSHYVVVRQIGPSVAVLRRDTCAVQYRRLHRRFRMSDHYLKPAQWVELIKLLFKDTYN